MNRLSRSALKTALRSGSIALLVHTILVLALGPAARHWVKAVDRPVLSLINDVANYTADTALVHWLVEATSFRTGVAVFELLLYGLLGGLFYFTLVFALACLLPPLRAPSAHPVA